MIEPDEGPDSPVTGEGHDDAEKLEVLIVDDQSQIRDIFRDYLSPDIIVYEAASASAAHDIMDDSIDTIVLDRNMSGTTGDEFLEQIRNEGYSCPVTMVTAVFPDFDIARLDVDAYLLKPVGRLELRNSIAAVLSRDGVGEPVREYFGLLSKSVALEDEIAMTELEGDEEYSRLQTRMAELESEVSSVLETMEMDEVRPLIADFSDLEDERISRVLPAESASVE